MTSRAGRFAASASPLRATAIVGVGSALTLLLSVLAAKAFAVLIGPHGVGQLSLLQATLNLAVIVSGAGLSTTVIRSSASRPATRSSEPLSLLLGIAFGMGGGVVLLMFHEPIAAIVLGSAGDSTQLIFVAIALTLSVVGGVITGTLTGRHRLRKVTAISVAGGLAVCALGIPLVAVYRESALGAVLGVTAATQLILGILMLRPTVDLTNRLRVSRQAVAAVLREGTPIALSQLVGQGIQLGLPILILHMLSAVEVGYYRAATAVSVGYLTFFLATLTQDFFPRISAARGVGEVGLAIERRMRLLMGLGTPMILMLLALSPILIDVLYSSAFRPGIALLQWQLVGDLLRLPGWVLTFALLSSGRTPRYFLVEFFTGAILLVLTIAGVSAFGLSGAGIAYALTQALRLVILWFAVRGIADTRPGRLQAALVVLFVAASGLLLSGLAVPVETMAFAAGAVIVAFAAWPILIRLHRRQLLE